MMADDGPPRPQHSAGGSPQGNAGPRQPAQARQDSTTEDTEERQRQRQEILSRFPVMQSPSVDFVFKQVTDLLSQISSVDQAFLERDGELKAREEDFKRRCEERQHKWDEEQAITRTRFEDEQKAFDLQMKWKMGAFEKQKEEFEARIERSVARMSPRVQGMGVVVLNIGGTKFRTAIETLVKYHPQSTFTQLVKQLEIEQQATGDDGIKIKTIFIDRDPRHFPLILNYLRMGEAALQGTALHNATFPLLNEVLLDAQYYQLTELEQLIRWRMVVLGERLTFASLVERNNVFKPVPTPQGVPVALPEGESVATPKGEGAQIKYVTYTLADHEEAIDLEGKYLEGVVFDCVHFQHPVSLCGSVLCGAVFNTCQFSAPVNFIDADLRGVKFFHCSDVNHLIMTDVSSVCFDPPIVASPNADEDSPGSF